MGFLRLIRKRRDGNQRKTSHPSPDFVLDFSPNGLSLRDAECDYARFHLLAEVQLWRHQEWRNTSHHGHNQKSDWQVQQNNSEESKAHDPQKEDSKQHTHYCEHAEVCERNVDGTLASQTPKIGPKKQLRTRHRTTTRRASSVRSTGSHRPSSWRLSSYWSCRQPLLTAAALARRALFVTPASSRLLASFFHFQQRVAAAGLQTRAFDLRLFPSFVGCLNKTVHYTRFLLRHGKNEDVGRLDIDLCYGIRVKDSNSVFAGRAQIVLLRPRSPP